MSKLYNNHSGMSREDVEEMRRFRKIIESGFSSDPWARVGGKPETFSEPKGIQHDADDVITESRSPDKDMHKFVYLIDELYGNPVDATKKLMEASVTNLQIAEALDTQVNKTGVQIGKWQIRVRTDESKEKVKKYFDVKHSVSNQVVAKNLYLYEAALALVRYLNKGFSVDSYEIISLLELEKKYHAHRVDALTHKVSGLRAEKQGNHEKAFVFENRHSVAVANALKVEAQIKAISNSII